LGGFTLVEVVISIVVVGIMLVAALNTVGGVFRSYAIARERQQGYALATELMAEILQARYEDPNDSPVFGVESGESSTPRIDYDDVDDYDGWSVSPPQAKDGSAVPNSEGWTRMARVWWVDVVDPTTETGSETGLKKIKVEVTSPSGKQYKIKTLRSSSGMLELQPPLDRTYVAALQASLQLRSEAPPSEDAIAVSNHAEDE
jgi:prepilin-type N-terminal cleavage/methylation domain-containing protein